MTPPTAAPSTEATVKEATFKEAYGVLQRHAETLRTQREPNIDELLTIVSESMQAYLVCKARIDAVERALEAALAEPGPGEPA
jgi:exodeoxyribonuclease VII small subunit